MTNPRVYTSANPKNPDAFTGQQKKYWVEIQLVDEQGKAVANIPYRAENAPTRDGYIPPYSGKSDANGVVRIEKLHPVDLTLFLEAQSLSDEMETRVLRSVREEKNSNIRGPAERDGYIWHYAVIGELCDKVPTIEDWKEKSLPAFHFPEEKSFKGLVIKFPQLNKRHIIEICPFRAWELVLHHQNDYSMANAINLGAAASLAYADDNILDKASITQFFIGQCQDLSKVPQLHKDNYNTNTLVQDVPFSNRYQTPVYLDTSKGSNAEGDTQLFYTYNNDKLIVSWRGTASLIDGMTDFSFRPVKSQSCDIKMQCTELVSKGKVHYGFWNGYSLLGEKFKDEIIKINDFALDKQLFICGHSLGGALALIHAIEMRKSSPLLYTYGMPRTFTRDAVTQLTDIIHYRHVNDTDPVPGVPPEANMDNWLYDLYGPFGIVLGGFWSTLELTAYQLKPWGDCFWHHGKPIVFLETIQVRQWQDCKITFPEPNGCITIRKKLPLSAKLYLAPCLAEELAQTSGEQQKEFKSKLTQKDLNEYFPKGGNPERGVPVNIFRHFMTAYMPYINNKLLELIDIAGLSKDRHYTEHKDVIDKFKTQMSDNQHDIPADEYKRNEIFLELESLLTETLNPTLALNNGNVGLERFAHYGVEEIEQ